MTDLYSSQLELANESASPPARERGAVLNNTRFVQGEFEITIVSDGYITVPIDIVAPEGTPEERDEILLRTGNPKAGLVESKTNIPVIRKGNDLILVDIGSGNKYQPSDGRLSANLDAAGIDAGAITKVVFTHAHPDHVWGTLTEAGSLRFPNATYYVGATEWDFWMDPDYLTNMPDVLHEFALGAQRDLGAIKDRVVMLKPGDDIVTGLRALDTAGHTPGHLSLEMAGGEGLIISADAADQRNRLIPAPEGEVRLRHDSRSRDQEPGAADRARRHRSDQIAGLSLDLSRSWLRRAQRQWLSLCPDLIPAWIHLPQALRPLRQFLDEATCLLHVAGRKTLGELVACRLQHGSGLGRAFGPAPEARQAGGAAQLKRQQRLRLRQIERLHQLGFGFFLGVLRSRLQQQFGIGPQDLRITPERIGGPAPSETTALMASGPRPEKCEMVETSTRGSIQAASNACFSVPWWSCRTCS